METKPRISGSHFILYIAIPILVKAFVYFVTKDNAIVEWSALLVYLILWLTATNYAISNDDKYKSFYGSIGRIYAWIALSIGYIMIFIDFGYLLSNLPIWK